MIEEEDKKCLKIHGYVSSSENESEPDDSKFELDEQFEALKPPPIIIDPEKHKIIVIEDDGDNFGPVESNVQDSRTGRVYNSNIPLHMVNGKDYVSKKLSKWQKQKANTVKNLKDLDSFPDPNYKVVYDLNFPPLGGKSSLFLQEKVTKSNEKEKVEESTRGNDSQMVCTVDMKISKSQKKRYKRKRQRLTVEGNNMQDSSVSVQMISRDVKENVLDKLSEGQKQKATTIMNLKDCDSFCDYHKNYDQNFSLLADENSFSTLPKKITMEYLNDYHSHHPYGESDFENYLLFKESYLNGVISTGTHSPQEDKAINNHINYDKVGYDQNFPLLTDESTLPKKITKSNEKEEMEESSREDDSQLTYIVNMKKSKSRKKRKRKNQILKYVYMEYLNDYHSHHPYQEADFENYLLFKENYLNGVVSAGTDSIQNDKAIKSQKTGNKNSLLNYIGSVTSLHIMMQFLIHIRGLLWYNDKDTPNCNNLSDKKKYQLDFYRLLNIAVNYVNNLGIQCNHFFADKQIYFIEIKCTPTLRIALFYNGFLSEVFCFTTNKLSKQIYMLGYLCLQFVSAVKIILMESTPTSKSPKIICSDHSRDFVLLCKNLHFVLKNFGEKAIEKVTSASLQAQLKLVKPNLEQIEETSKNIPINLNADVAKLHDLALMEDYSTGHNSGHCLGQSQLCKSLVEDLTQNRKHFYDGGYQNDNSDSSRTFCTHYLNKDVSGTISNPPNSNNCETHEVSVQSQIQDGSIETVTDYWNLRTVAKVFILYLLLKQPWFLNLITIVIVKGIDLFILISLFIYLSAQFFINY